ncbi:MAG: DUF493 family protein [Salinivirgaceae bacterium]
MNSLHQSYEKLRQLLLSNPQWPRLYMFKFIVPNKQGNVERVVGLLPEGGAIAYKHTENLKYVSITCTHTMASADHIIEITKNITEIKGVMAL